MFLITLQKQIRTKKINFCINDCGGGLFKKITKKLNYKIIEKKLKIKTERVTLKAAWIGEQHSYHGFFFYVRGKFTHF